jgi:hypothetical protein
MPSNFDFPITYLNSNDGSSILAFGSTDSIIVTDNNSLERLTEFIRLHSNCYLFGSINLKIYPLQTGMKLHFLK